MAIMFILVFQTIVIYAETISKNEFTLTAGVSDVLYSIIQSSENIEYKKVYVTGDNVNIRIQPSVNSKIIDRVNFNDELFVSNSSNESWLCILHNGEIAYVNSDYVSVQENSYKEFNAPYAKNKTWMSYKSITNKKSKQYKLQKIAYTGKFGIRMVNDRYCVALGSYFECEIGQYFDLILSNGTVIKCIMGDQKDDKHTDSNNIITVNSDCMSEFIVDSASLDKKAKRTGSVSNCCEEWNSAVVKVRVYERVVDIE